MPQSSPAVSPQTAAEDRQPGGITFESAWSTATGTGVAALTDGGRWDNGACPMHEVLTVVPGGSVGFTLTPNVLRVQFRGGGPCGVLQKQDAVPESTTHYARFYFRNDEVGNLGNHMFAYNNLHSQSGGPIQAAPFSRNAVNAPPGKWVYAILQQFDYPRGRWHSPPLQNGTWYRIEYEFEYVTASTIRVWPRISDMDGRLLYTSDDFRHEGSATETLTGWYDVRGANRASPLGVLNGSRSVPRLARHIGLGNEGPAKSTDSGGYYYFAKVAFSTIGWIGR